MADDLVERLRLRGTDICIEAAAALIDAEESLRHFGELAEDEHNALRARIALLEAALRPFAEAFRIERADGNITGRAEFTCCLSVRVGACLTAAAALADAPAPGQAKAPSGG